MSGGQVANADNGAARGRNGDFDLAFDQTYTLRLQNLIPGQILVLRGAALDAKNEPITSITTEEKIQLFPASGGPAGRQQGASD